MNIIIWKEYRLTERLVSLLRIVVIIIKFKYNTFVTITYSMTIGTLDTSFFIIIELLRKVFECLNTNISVEYIIQ